MPKSEVFLDTSYAIALAVRADQNHPQALELAAWLHQDGIRLVRTWAILLEIGNSLAKQRYRPAGRALIDALIGDPSVDVVPLSQTLCARALELYVQRRDKEWGLTDCISFVVMDERGIRDALTADVHFRQAGFGALLHV